MPLSPEAQILLHWLNRLPTNRPGAAIGLDSRLIEDGLLDSIGILELVSFVEERFGLALPLEDFVPENFATPAAVLALVARLRQPAAAD